MRTSPRRSSPPWMRSRANDHGVSATPENVSCCRHGRFPHPGPLPEGGGDAERAARDFHRLILAQRPDASPCLPAPSDGLDAQTQPPR
jgi:hypothetical protein